MAVSSVLDYTLLDEAEIAREIADFYRNLNNVFYAVGLFLPTVQHQSLPVKKATIL